MTNDLKVRGGQVLNLVAHHPIASGIAALIVAVPSAALAGTSGGLVAGAFMAMVGIVVGAPLGAMIATDMADS